MTTTEPWVPEVAEDYEIRWGPLIPFFTVHVLAVAGILYLGWSWSGFALAMASYAIRMFGVTGAMHRYFAHRSFKTGRVFQAVLAFLGTICVQKGVLWWAAHHRHHHKFSDMPEDVHSPIQRGFWWSHVGWILVKKHDHIREEEIKDLLKYPELRFLQRWELAIVVAFAASFFFVADAMGGSGLWALTWGFFVSTTLLWHGTFTINSFSHLLGRRRYKTTDDSRNNWLLAIITMGEGWHNNHHYYQRSASQGFFWWELDLTYYVLKGLQAIGLVSGVARPPRHVRDAIPEDASYDGPPATSIVRVPRVA
jgi:stearoyl-CoA desaturase (delta-9 desaturase)